MIDPFIARNIFDSIAKIVLAFSFGSGRLLVNGSPRGGEIRLLSENVFRLSCGRTCPPVGLLIKDIVQ